MGCEGSTDNSTTLQDSLYEASQDEKFAKDVDDRIADFFFDEELTKDALIRAATAKNVGERRNGMDNDVKMGDDDEISRFSFSPGSRGKTTSHESKANNNAFGVDADEEMNNADAEMRENDSFSPSIAKRQHTPNRTKTSNESADTLDQHINYKELYLFQLRTKVLGLAQPTFTTELWRFLQMAGWTYVQGTYRPPKAKRPWTDPEELTNSVYKVSGVLNALEMESEGEEGTEIFETSNQIVEYLDQYSLPNTNLTPFQIKKEQERLATNSAAYRRKCKRLRFELLEIVYRDRLRKKIDLYGVGGGNDGALKSKYGHNHRPCEICFTGASPMYPRVACRDCGLVVHTSCYGLTDYQERKGGGAKGAKNLRNVDAKGLFQCEVCKVGLSHGYVNKSKLWNAPQSARWRAFSHPNAVCQLCDSQLIAGGMVQVVKDIASAGEARRRSRDKQSGETWVHIHCYNALTGRGYKYMSGHGSEVVDQISKVQSSGAGKNCSYCAKRGLIVACNKKCGNHFHPLCIQIKQPRATMMNGKVRKCLQCAGSSEEMKSSDHIHTDRSLVAKPLPEVKPNRANNSDQYFKQPPKKQGGKDKIQDKDTIAVPLLETSIAEARQVYAAEKSEELFIQFESQYKTHFHEWAFTLSTGQSILLYGLGSKRCVLDLFGDALATEGNVICMNGYDADFDLTELLDLLIRIVSPPDTRSPFDTYTDSANEAEIERRWTAKAAYIAEHYSDERPLFLLVHNIDGKRLSSKSAQEALAILTANSKRDGCPMIRIAASIDDINVSMSWDPRAEHKYGWVWKQVHTYRPHFEEITKGPRQTSQKKTKKVQSSKQEVAINAVLQSLAPKHKDVVKLLATLQSQGSAITYINLKDECLKSLIVSSDSTLRNILKELKDHGMVLFGNTGEALYERETVFIPSDAIVDEILAFE